MMASDDDEEVNGAGANEEREIKVECEEQVVVTSADQTLFFQVRAAPKTVQTLLQDLGWEKRSFDELVASREGAIHILWDIARIPLETLQTLSATHQRVNRVHALQALTTKHRLQQHLIGLSERFPDVFNFFPRGFELPRQLAEFQLARKPGSVYICKPTGMCAGMDISFITDDWSVEQDLAARAKSVRKQSAFVCQHYIHPPHLIGTIKYDLRLYVLVTKSHIVSDSSTKPLLTVWLHDQGLVRFCSRPYSSEWTDRYAHLSNTAINRSRAEGFAPEWAEALEKIVAALGPSEPPKWRLVALQQYFGEETWQRVWSKVIRLINLTIVPLSTLDGVDAVCFELLGFDVLFDANLEPYLLEVNGNPSMSFEALMDIPLKKAVLQDLFTLMSLPREEINKRAYHGRSDGFLCTFCPDVHAQQEPYLTIL